MHLTAQCAQQPSITTSDHHPSVLHVGIIMDGNGRWAQARNLPRRMGHYYGTEAARKIVKAAAAFGVTHLTLFGFSSENWRRPKPEVDYLMSLLRGYLRKDAISLHDNNVRLKVIGERSALPADIVTLIHEVECLTQGNTGLTLSIALNYGGRADITASVRHLAFKVAEGRLDPAAIDEAVVGSALPSAELPDLDLLIRTSGEQRVSNFLLWQIAYSEMLFVKCYWPDFSGEELKAALNDFRQRDRRFGRVV